MFKNIFNLSDRPPTGEDKTRLDRKKMQTINQETISWLNRSESDLDPVVLNPETCTLKDIEYHALTEQYLSKKTVEKRIRYLIFMGKHPYPVDFRNPDKKEFLRHVRYRLLYEDPPATTHALRHEKLAINMVREAYGFKPIQLRLPPTPKHKKMVIPLPDIVRKFWKAEYEKDKAINKLYQYMFRISFLLGLRMPSELALLTTDSIIFNENGTAVITIIEAKKHFSERTLILPKYIATDKHHKTLKNWIDVWRPKIAKSSTNALFTTKYGDPWGPENLAKYLRKHGKKVWEPYHPYISRHWSCIARLIDQFDQYGHWNAYVVKNWHGHDTIKSTEKYIAHAEQYYNVAQYNWLKRVLKAPRKQCGENTLKIKKGPKNPSFEWKPFESPVWARPHPNQSLLREKSSKCRYHAFLICSINSFFPSFFIIIIRFSCIYGGTIFIHEFLTKIFFFMVPPSILFHHGGNRCKQLLCWTFLVPNSPHSIPYDHMLTSGAMYSNGVFYNHNASHPHNSPIHDMNMWPLVCLLFFSQNLKKPPSVEWCSKIKKYNYQYNYGGYY